mgnify:CR=1 FL=1
MILTSKGFNILRHELFGGSLTMEQVIALHELVDLSTESSLTYPEAAYVLATVFHETDKTMLPIVERGSDKYLSKYDTGKLAKNLGNTPEADGDGQKFKGRGYVQLTGLANYAKFGKLLGIDLVGNPDLACDPIIAGQIMILGMTQGLFTGVGFQKKRSVLTYDRNKYIAARQIINGNDKAVTIADYAMVFEKALRSN